jgi:tetratricopeptide (TPR) repeat protein
MSPRALVLAAAAAVSLLPGSFARAAGRPTDPVAPLRLEPEPDCAPAEAAKAVPLSRLGRMLELGGDRAAAERLYRQWETQTPCLRALARFNLARLSEAAGDRRGAAALFDQARVGDARGAELEELAQDPKTCGAGLLEASLNHPAPFARLARARACFAAQAAAGRDAHALLGLALTEPDPDAAPLREPATRDLIRKLAAEKSFTVAELVEAALLLRERGASSKTLAALLGAGAPGAAADSEAGILSAAFAASAAGRHGVSAELWRAFLEKRPGEPRALRALAGEAVLHGPRRPALEALLDVEPLERDPVRFLRLSKVYARFGDRRHALGMLERIDLGHPWPGRERGSAVGLARALIESGNPSGALEALRLAQEEALTAAEKAESVTLYLTIAELPTATLVPGAKRRQAATELVAAQEALQKGDKAAARETLARAEGLSPNPEETRKLAELRLTLGETDKAAALLSALIRRQPGNPRARLDLARLELSRGDRKAAQAQVDAARHGAGFPEDDWARAAQTYQDLGSHENALQLRRRLAERFPEDAAALHDLAVSEYFTGRHEDALRDLRRAKALAPARLETYLTLGFVCTARGLKEEALAVYSEGLAHPAAAESADLRARLETSRAALSAGGPGKRR